MSVSYVDYYRSNSSVAVTVLALAAVAVVVALAVPRRRLLTALTGVSLAGVLGLTLVPVGGWSDLWFTPGALRSMVVNLQPDGRSLHAWVATGDGPLNVLLFLPLGLCGALLTRRPVTTAVAATLLSVGIECWQSSLTTRVGSLADVCCNGLGAVVGAALAAVLLAGAHLRPASAAGRHGS